MNDTELRELAFEAVLTDLVAEAAQAKKPEHLTKVFNDLKQAIANHSASVEREAYKKGYIDGGIGVINEKNL